MRSSTGLLVIALGMMAVGCYRPSVSDCEVSCTSADACADGQVCASAGLCVDEDHVDECSSLSPDGGVGADAAGDDVDGGDSNADAALDANPSDADVPDATNLRILISGRGSVVLEDPPFTCTATSLDGAPYSAECTVVVTSGMDVSLVPVKIHQSKEFLQWTGDDCAGQGSPCTLIASGDNQLVVAEFEN